MPIAPNTITIQPDTGWVLTTVPTIVYVDRAPRTRNVTLLGTPVIIRATASAYTWTWGDGAQTVTTQPGAAYPNATVTHTYMYEEQDVVVRLTTSWRGSYSTNGGASWLSAPGVAHDVDPDPGARLQPALGARRLRPQRQLQHGRRRASRGRVSAQDEGRE